VRIGQRVVCVNAQGWFIPDLPGPRPQEGSIYTIAGLKEFDGIAAVALKEFPPNGYYAAFRFAPLKADTSHVEIAQEVLA
jgi:hypothetical protein